MRICIYVSVYTYIYMSMHTEIVSPLPLKGLMGQFQTVLPEYEPILRVCVLCIPAAPCVICVMRKSWATNGDARSTLDG